MRFGPVHLVKHKTLVSLIDELDVLRTPPAPEPIESSPAASELPQAESYSPSDHNLLLDKVHQLRGSLTEARRELRAMGVDVDSDSRFSLDADDGFKFVPRPAGVESTFVEPPTPAPSPIASFHVLDSWVSRFEVEKPDWDGAPHVLFTASR